MCITTFNRGRLVCTVVQWSLHYKLKFEISVIIRLYILHEVQSLLYTSVKIAPISTNRAYLF